MNEEYLKPIRCYFQAKDNKPTIDVRLEKDTVWLSQNQLCVLFQRDKRTISERINNIYREGELTKKSTVRKFRAVQTEGNRNVSRYKAHHDLDVIISVGYRIKSNMEMRLI